MTASHPRDPAIALVGEGSVSLLAHRTAHRLSLQNREITILETNDDPVATYPQDAHNLGQTVLVGRLPRSDRPDAVLSPGAARLG